MRVFILTSCIRGYASRVLPGILTWKNVDFAGVVLAQSLTANKKRLYLRKLKKLGKIGIGGTINAIRMREWYEDRETESLEALCAKHGVKVFHTRYLQSSETKEIVASLNADLGLSLGNGYIPEKIFSAPSLGMINVHTELLPEYQNAHSIIWPIYFGKRETGFTVHKVEKGIDAGRILFQDRYPIVFRSTLRETVKLNLATSNERVPRALRLVCEDFPSYLSAAKEQGKGKVYTTPSIWQFLQMRSMNKKMYQADRAGGS